MSSNYRFARNDYVIYSSWTCYIILTSCLRHMFNAQRSGADCYGRAAALRCAIQGNKSNCFLHNEAHPRRPAGSSADALEYCKLLQGT